MSDRCYSLDELVAAEIQPRGEAMRKHLAGCPRCRAALGAYRDFIEGGEPPAAARKEWAGTRLQAALEGEILGHAGVSQTEALSAPEARAGEAGPGRWRAWLASLGWRPAWAAAGLTVAALVILLPWSLLRPRVPEPVLRGPVIGQQLQLQAEAHATPSGDVVFTWSAAASADRYEVRFYGGGLAEVARRTATEESSLTLDAAALRRIGAVRYWQVAGFRGDTEVIRTPLHELPTPETPDSGTR